MAGGEELSVGDWRARAPELALIGCARPPASEEAGRGAGKMAAAVLQLWWLLAAAAAAGAEGAARTLVLLENSNLRDTHSLFFRSLAGRARGAGRGRRAEAGGGDALGARRGGCGLW